MSLKRNLCSTVELIPILRMLLLREAKTTRDRFLDLTARAKTEKGIEFSELEALAKWADAVSKAADPGHRSYYRIPFIGAVELSKVIQGVVEHDFKTQNGRGAFV